jgi:hypothetical protein
LGGTTGARVFRRGAAPEEFSEGGDLSSLLALAPKFDSRLEQSPAAPRV